MTLLDLLYCFALSGILLVIGVPPTVTLLEQSSAHIQRAKLIYRITTDYTTSSITPEPIVADLDTDTISAPRTVRFYGGEAATPSSIQLRHQGNTYRFTMSVRGALRQL